MVITVECPSCKTSFPVDPSKIPEAGVNARCSSCATVFRVERPAAEAPAPVPEPVAVAEEPRVAEPAPVAEEIGGAAAPADDWVVERTDDQTATAEVVDEGLASDSVMFAADDLPAPAAETEPAAEAVAEPVEPEPVAVPAAEPEPEAAEPAPPAPEPEPEAAEPPPPAHGFTFGKRDPADKAKRLARVLVSDMIMYNPERHEKALAEGTLKNDFEDEIEKSWKEYVEQVGEKIAEGEGKGFWTEALNDVLAQGEQIF